MSKSVLMSLSPYYYYLIGEGIKTEEVRKTIPKALDWNKHVECYMAKDEKSFKRIPKEFQEKYRAHIGKVGMRFTCNEINCYEYGLHCPQYAESYFDCYEGYIFDFVCDERHCLSTTELYAYGNKKSLSSWHISDLVIYDKPRELGEFERECFENFYEGIGSKICHKCEQYLRATIYEPCDCKNGGYKPLTRPPQSWQYIYD